MIQILPIADLPEVRPGNDLCDLLAPALTGKARPGDILVVTQKIVSKAEDRFVALESVVPSPQARELATTVRKDPRLVELVVAESTDVLRAVPGVLITRQRGGHVMANAGIDQSNLGGGQAERVLLLPEDADRSAATIAAGLRDRLGFALPVVVSDSFGRPWRMGVVNVAIGASGLAALVDHRGRLDRDGRPLEVTQVALADMLATAAGLAMGEGHEGVPAAIVRGVAFEESTAGVAPLVRPLDQDLFR